MFTYDYRYTCIPHGFLATIVELIICTTHYAIHQRNTPNHAQRDTYAQLHRSIPSFQTLQADLGLMDDELLRVINLSYIEAVVHFNESQLPAI